MHALMHRATKTKAPVFTTQAPVLNLPAPRTGDGVFRRRIVAPHPEQVTGLSGAGHTFLQASVLTTQAPVLNLPVPRTGDGISGVG